LFCFCFLCFFFIHYFYFMSIFGEFGLVVFFTAFPAVSPCHHTSIQFHYSPSFDIISPYIYWLFSFFWHHGCVRAIFTRIYTGPISKSIEKRGDVFLKLPMLVTFRRIYEIRQYKGRTLWFWQPIGNKSLIWSIINILVITFPRSQQIQNLYPRQNTHSYTTTAENIQKQV
jgi:hypothetical protein